MQAQTFRATGFDAALMRVREELGPDAVILSSREMRGGTVELRAAAGRQTDQGAPLLQQRLARMGVPMHAAATLATELLRVHGRVPEALSRARGSLARVLEQEMIFAGPITTATRAVALVGPTGVGKTTTLAKIAARAALVDHRRVGVVCLDQYRIAAADQLQRYADLIGIPMEVAHDGDSLAHALRQLNDMELVLIDTAGRSPRDRDALTATGRHLRHAGENIEVHLCLPANVASVELGAIVELHGEALRPRRLIATKLDEAVYHGSLVAAQVHGGVPFSYFTTGQRVPEDIEVGSPERLASLLCGDPIDSIHGIPAEGARS